MNIVEALHSEEAKLQRQLTAVKSAIAALNGGGTTVVSPQHVSIPNGNGGKRTLSAAGRANIIQAAKARWAKIRAEKAEKAKYPSFGFQFPQLAFGVRCVDHADRRFIHRTSSCRKKAKSLLTQWVLSHEPRIRTLHRHRLFRRTDAQVEPEGSACLRGRPLDRPAGSPTASQPAQILDP